MTKVNICTWCGDKYSRRQGNQRFCTIECGKRWWSHNQQRPLTQDLHRKKGTGSFGLSNGYPTYSIKLGNHYLRQKMHRIIGQYAVRQLLPYPPVEIHHIDGDKTNWTPSNLVICYISSAHRILNIITEAVKLGATFSKHPNIEGATWIRDLLNDDLNPEEAIGWWIKALLETK